MSYQDQTTVDQTVTPLRDEKLATHDLFATLSADPSLSFFLDAVKRAALDPFLSGPDLYTILAPSNQAFRPGQPPVDAIRDCILRGAFTAAELGASDSIKTLDGKPLPIAKRDGDL
ncbi:MAG: hypothetical protein JO022_18530, partial [Acidobacteriaceae bacterium]|nr:hypothetical protein [Acidobacteriaceae bacterium]